MPKLGRRSDATQNPVLKLVRYPRSLAPTFVTYVDHSHCLVLALATIAALPSTRAIPDRDVFYVAHPALPR